MRFEFQVPTRILFGSGTVKEVAPLAKPLGQRALVITGGDPGRAAPLLEQLRAQGCAVAVFSVPGEPTIERVRSGVECAREAGCDLVVGLGGGSVLDAGKAVAAILSNGGDPLDYLEL